MQHNSMRGRRFWKIAGVLAAAVCVVLELALLAGTWDDPVAQRALWPGVVRIVVAALAAVTLFVGWPAFSALCALFLLVPVGFYFLGAENHLVLIGIGHLALLIASIVLAVLHFGAAGQSCG